MTPAVKERNYANAIVDSINSQLESDGRIYVNSICILYSDLFKEIYQLHQSVTNGLGMSRKLEAIKFLETQYPDPNDDYFRTNFPCSGTIKRVRFREFPFHLAIFSDAAKEDENSVSILELAYGKIHTLNKKEMNKVNTEVVKFYEFMWDTLFFS